MAEEQGNPYGQLIAKAWTDEAFKARLKADPKAAMKEVSMDAPEGMEIEVVESTHEKGHLVIPPKPVGELSKEDLDKVAGGISSPNASRILGVVNVLRFANTPFGVGCRDCRCEPSIKTKPHCQ